VKATVGACRWGMRVSGALAKAVSGQIGRVSRDESGVWVGVVVFGNMRLCIGGRQGRVVGAAVSIWCCLAIASERAVGGVASAWRWHVDAKSLFGKVHL
jgi:hypothetical protein